MIANWLSNGLGGQSMYLLHLAAQRIIPATLSITADTGSENDRVCSTGERMTAPEFFQRYVQPYGERYGIETVMVRSVDKDKKPLPPLIDVLRQSQGDDFQSLTKGISVPLFTNDRSAGRLKQSCTDKWKVRAIHQEARRRGVKLLHSAIGFHAGEAHRLKGNFTEESGGFSYYQPLVKRKKQLTPIKWLRHYYPLIDLKLNREQIRQELERVNLPYLVTTECDMCPHQDYARWKMHTPEVINEIAKIEAKWDGKLFFTDRRIPLKEALREMAALDEIRQLQGSLFDLPDFGCESGAYCGI